MSLIGATTGATGTSVTINSQVSSSEPASLLARIVMVCGLPAAMGLAQLTTPVSPLMLIPAGALTKDQLTGWLPWFSTGLGPV
jgi:hypothetical protein